MEDLEDVGTIKEYFEMSRHERRGAIVVLAIISALLVGTLAVRCNHESVDPSSAVDIRQFEVESDSAALTFPASKPKKPAASRKKHHRASPKSPKSPKPAPAPRRLDPVPQF